MCVFCAPWFLGVDGVRVLSTRTKSVRGWVQVSRSGKFRGWVVLGSLEDS
jgi:uncharacterized protein YgiM (DUF1202 family)